MANYLQTVKIPLNSGDTDPMPHYAVSDLDLHCLPITLFGVSWLKWIKHSEIFNWLCWVLTTRQPLWVILRRLQEKGRKEIEEIVEKNTEIH